MNLEELKGLTFDYENSAFLVSLERDNNIVT